MDRRRDLAGSEPISRDARGSALFADISGFTNLTEDLSRSLGPRRGAEKLTVYLNQVFGPVTDIVHRMGGSVIAFGGDSVTCWFESDNGIQATIAALQLVDFVHRLRDELDDIAGLDIKAAVASGRASRLGVGRPEHSYMDVIAGEAIEALSEQSSMLGPGEVAVTADVVEALGSKAEFRTVTREGRVRYLIESYSGDSPHVAQESSLTVGEAEAADWLLPAVHENVSQGLGSLLAELRPLVTIFVGFDGISFTDDPEAGAKLDACVSWAQEVIAEYEGIVLQTLIDDKGSHLYAVFGASVSHEDESRRAVVAALKLASPPEDSGIEAGVSVGVSSGVAFVGAYGGPSRMTYGVHGPSVSLAARIMQQTPAGSVHVSEDIVREPGHRATFTAVGSAMFKGINRPVAVHSAVAATSAESSTTDRRLHESGLIGRDDERSALAAGLARLHSGESSTFVVEGPAGIGKSRLLLDFIAQADLLGTTLISTSADEIEQSTAFFAWRGVLRKLFGSEGVDAEARLLEFVAEDEWRADRIGLLAPMIATPVTDTYLTDGMEPDLRGENTRQLLSAIVRDAPRPAAPLILVLDDAHWMDSASWAVAERVVSEVPSLLVVIATRPFVEGAGHPEPDEYRRLIEGETAERIVLSELNDADSLQL
ncbi:MAG: AAA family ATPase, partial [Acidimicrobiia bacterium]